MKITSTAFEHGKPIPLQYTGDGQDVSPPLSWTGVPANGKELALICDDPDAPTKEPWVHWVIYKIPATNSGLPEGVPPVNTPPHLGGAMQGLNTWHKAGYGGPAPPKGHGVHHYHFKLYALDAPLSVKPGLDKKGLLKAMEGHIVGQAELVGTYER
jgi:Raf kinase inhibitor-like YbhB/YbcL family protein